MLPSQYDLESLNQTLNDTYIIRQVKKQNKYIQCVLCLLLGIVIVGFVIFIFF